MSALHRTDTSIVGRWWWTVDHWSLAAVAVLIAFGANAVARAFDRVKVVELWARRLTGVLFIVIGVYFSLAFIFEIVPVGRG
ncbi:MAG: hypothetical protein KDA33_07785 [Phycisphaerales bacterium]|nr:hypothetical protein [Phycisphaerales bacterium]